MEKKTVVLLPNRVARENQHGDCIDALKNLGVETLEFRDSSQIDIARSHLATAALAFGADVAVFIDSDILFDSLDVERLAELAREREAVVGAPYSLRKMGAGFTGRLSPGEQDIEFFEGGKVYESTGTVGMGFTAIHRSVFAKVAALPEYMDRNTQEGILTPYFQKIVVDGYWLHEDASFCHAARRAGAATLIDTRVRVKHLGYHPFGIEDCRRSAADEKTLKLRVRTTG